MNDDADDRLLERLARVPLYTEAQIDAGLSAGHGTGRLSAAELLVVEQLAAGLTTREIAAALGKSPDTVKSQLKSARAAMGARNNAHLVARAWRAYLID